jgi:hypothetical protein
MYLAKLVGLYLFILALAMLMHPQRFKKIIAEANAESPLLVVTGSINLIIGLLLVFCHNMWVSDWRVLITLFAWFMLIQGVMRLLFPHALVKFFKDLQAKAGFALLTWIWLVVGAYLIWVGFSL